MNKTDLLHKYLNPRILFLFMLIPFMCICPLVLGSLTIGFPYPYLENNATLKSYDMVFEQIFSTTDSITPVGKEFSKISTIKQRRGSCTLFSGNAFITNLSQPEISAKFLKKFSDVAATYQSDAKLYALIRNAEIKIIPIDVNEPFSNVDVTLDLRKDFELSESDMPKIIETLIEEAPEPVEEETTDTEIPVEETEEVKPEPIPQDVIYLAYLINTKAFDSLDFRCN
jgi:hypothetical protein